MIYVYIYEYGACQLILTFVVPEKVCVDMSSNNSTLSTPDDMLNGDGEEEIIVTSVGLKEGTNVPNLVYAIGKNPKYGHIESDSESKDGVDKKRVEKGIELG